MLKCIKVCCNILVIVPKMMGNCAWNVSLKCVHNTCTVRIEIFLALYVYVCHCYYSYFLVVAPDNGCPKSLSLGLNNAQKS